MLVAGTDAGFSSISISLFLHTCTRWARAHEHIFFIFPFYCVWCNWKMIYTVWDILSSTYNMGLRALGNFQNVYFQKFSLWKKKKGGKLCRCRSETLQLETDLIWNQLECFVSSEGFCSTSVCSLESDWV